jgi:hypothetical protein
MKVVMEQLWDTLAWILSPDNHHHTTNENELVRHIKKEHPPPPQNPLLDCGFSFRENSGKINFFEKFREIFLRFRHKNFQLNLWVVVKFLSSKFFRTLLEFALLYCPLYSEATSLDWKISVTGKTQCSAIQLADEKSRIYWVWNVGKTVLVHI